MSEHGGINHQFLEMTADLAGYEDDPELAYKKLHEFALEQYERDLEEAPEDRLTAAFRIDMFAALRAGRPVLATLRRQGYLINTGEMGYLATDLADWLHRGSQDDLITPEQPDAEVSWDQQMACATEDPRDFNPPGGGMTPEAEDVCFEICKVREQCLAYALANGMDEGIWGGKSENERRQLAPGGLPRKSIVFESYEDMVIASVLAPDFSGVYSPKAA